MFRFSEKSGVHGFSGLHGTSGVYGNSGAYRISGFNPLDLDPYLLFDTQSSMIGTLENPTLDLDPSKPDTLNVITATRAGTATYTDANGVIQTASPDTVRVDYTQGEELTPTVFQHFGQTNFDDPAWQKTVTSITADDALAPDGTATADRMVIPPTANSQSSRLTEASNITSGTTVTISFYAKADGSINPLVLFANGSVFARILFNLQSETSSIVDGALSITHNIEEAANGFYRCSATFTSAGIGSISIRNATAGDGVSSLLLWGPQLEEGTTASDFVANTTGSPKFITGATYGPRVPMILVEPSATNLVTRSEDFTTGWTADDVSITGGQSSPDGGEVATLLKGNTNSSRHHIARFGMTNTVTGSFSIFAKYKELRYLQIASANTASQYANFDLLSGTVGTVASDFSDAKMEAYPDGWYRITVVSPNRYNNYYISLVSSLTAGWLESWSMPNDTDGLYIWGAQLEESPVATSYIPTSGSTVTRAADALEISGSAFSDFYNQSEGTFYAESSTKVFSSYIFQASSSVGNPYQNRHVAYYDSLNKLGVYSATGGVAQYSKVSLAADYRNTLTRIAYSYKQADFRVSFNGEAEPTPTGNQVPSSTIDQIHFGDTQVTGTHPLNGHIKRFIYWPYHSDSL